MRDGKKWFESIWVAVAALLIGLLVGYLLRGCYMDGASGINL